MIVFAGISFKIWTLKDVSIRVLTPLFIGFVSLWFTVTLVGGLNIILQLLFLLISYLVFRIVTKQFGKEDKDLFEKIFKKARK